MNMKLLQIASQTALASALLLPMAIAPDADARAWYVKASVGQTAEADVSGLTLDDGFVYGAGLGTSVGPVRVEAGVNRLSGEADFGFVAIDTAALDYHATGYLDLPVGDNASVFVGAGVDYIQGEASIFGGSIDAEGDGYHYAFGGAYRLSQGVIVEGQFREISADLDTDFGAVDLSASEITVGLRLAL
jgi:opacity protein-like surface antigen